MSTLPTQRRASFLRRWRGYVNKLVAAGFNKHGFSKLGQGKSIVAVKPRVSLALTQMTLVRQGRGPVKSESVVLVRWKVGGRWYIAAAESSPNSITRFLLKNKPH